MASLRSSGELSLLAIDSSRARSPEGTKLRMTARFTLTSVVARYTSSRICRFSGPPIAPR